MKPIAQAEYIWLDGAKPTQQVRSKTRMVAAPKGRDVAALLERARAAA